MLKAEIVKNTGDDLMVANAARVSFNKHSFKFSTRQEKPKGSDEGILDYLAREHHWTPFSHVRYTFTSGRPLVDLDLLNSNLMAGMEFKNGFKTVRHSIYGWFMLWKAKALLEPGIISFFAEALPYASSSFGILGGSDPFFPVHIDNDPRFIDVTMRETVPIFVSRQRFKHMVGFTYNEVSRRYVDDTPDFFTPDKWRGRAENKKQGSSDEDLSDKEIFTEYGKGMTVAQFGRGSDYRSMKVYEEMISAGVAPEQARMNLPQSMYTEYYVTGSLEAWRRAYKLRIASDSQKEIQDLAKQWDDNLLGEPSVSKLWAQIR